jgi:hypothetical protein
MKVAKDTVVTVRARRLGIDGRVGVLEGLPRLA